LFGGGDAFETDGRHAQPDEVEDKSDSGAGKEHRLIIAEIARIALKGRKLCLFFARAIFAIASQSRV